MDPVVNIFFFEVQRHGEGDDRRRGRADACIDAVGREPDIGSGFDAVIDRDKAETFMGTDRPHVLRQAIHCCRD